MDDALEGNGFSGGFDVGGILPGFLKRRRENRESETSTGSGLPKESGSPGVGWSDEAVKNLKSADKAAGKPITPFGDNLAETRMNERTAGGLFSGVGKKNKAKKGKVSGRLKKVGPAMAILLTIFGAGTLLGGAQLFLPFSLVAQFTETFNSMHTSANMRASTFFRLQMDSGRAKNPIKGRLFRADTFKLSEKQISRLSAQGIEYDDNYEGKGVRVLKFTDDAGDLKVVVADTKSLGKVGDGAVDFKTLYAENTEFFTKYNNGSRTWRGAIANWYGKTTDKFLSNNKITRNMWADYKKKMAEEGNNGKKVVQDILAKRTDTIQDGGISRLETEKDEDGNTIKNNADPESTTHKRGNIDVEEKLNNIKAKMMIGANTTCAIVDFIGATSLLVAANEALQIINIAAGYFNAVDQVKAGYGSESPINEMTKMLTEKATTTNVVIESASSGNGTVAKTEEGEVSVDVVANEVVSRNKAGMDAVGITSLYDGTKVNPNDPSVQSFNLSKSFKRILGGVGVGMGSFASCAVAKGIAAGASAALDLVEVLSCVATFWAGGGSCYTLIIGAVSSLAVSVGIGLTLSAVIAVILPWVSNALERDLVSQLGLDLGNGMTSGAGMYFGDVHKANGGSLSTTEEYTRFAMAQSEIIAENARYERANLSPFDMTSKYTFMGSLMTNLMGFMSTSSIMDVVNTTNTSLSTSISSLNPVASAYNISNNLPTMAEYEETCPYLASIGAIGDAFCNPLMITDVSTIDDDPADVVNKVDAFDPNNLSYEPSGKNVKINGNSRFSKYILFCLHRTSPFGVADNGIKSEVENWDVKTENSTINTTANAAIGAVPVIGDIFDIVNNTKAILNRGYISGESCVAGNTMDSAASESPSWEEAKYYQRFIEDQSLAESMGLIEKSAVAVFLDEYYEKNPLDNSYEGMLARYSGLDKETVIAILDVVDYADYIANYHPEERFAFGAPVVNIENEIEFDNENVLAGGYILLDKMSFRDLRNRSYAS